MTTVTQTYPILPTLKGLGFDVLRTPMWDNTIQRSKSGKKTFIRFWSSPLYQYEITYNFLRGSVAKHEFQDLMGFFNSLHGSADRFLYDDPDDDTVTTQPIGTGDGVTLTYQLVRTLGGFAEPVLAPNVVSAVYVDGVSISSSFWTVSAYGTAAPGVITFSGGHAPTAGKAVTADFTYYWPVNFTEDKMTFNKFLYQMWGAKKVTFETNK